MMSNLKEFRLTDLFIPLLSKGDNQAKDLESGDIPLVSAGSENNGYVKFIETGDGVSEIFDFPCITADMFGKCFVQTESFYSVSHGRVNILKPIFEEMDVDVLFYIAPILEKEFSLKYSYNRMLSLEKLTNTVIALPYIEDRPDFAFMKNEIARISKIAAEKSNNIIKISKGDPKTLRILSNIIDCDVFNKWARITNRKMSLKQDEWKEFKIGKLFKTYTGGDLIIGSVSEGEIPVASHSSTNNSIKIYSSEIVGRKIFNHNNTISLADRGTFFASIQKEDFYIGTRVKALEAKFQCSKPMLMFIVTIINNESYKFSYGRNCTGSLDDLTIFLPVILDGKNKPVIDNCSVFSEDGYIPDFEFMEKYILSLPYSNRIE